MAKQFGVNEGFSAYQRWCDNELEPFMKANGLDKYRDLTQNSSNEGAKFFTHKQIADRLYFSGKPTPKRIFTGHTFNSRFILEEIAADLAQYVNKIMDDTSEELKGQPTETIAIIAALNIAYDLSMEKNKFKEFSIQATDRIKKVKLLLDQSGIESIPS